MKFQSRMKSIFIITILLQAIVFAADNQQKIQILENNEYNYMAGCDFISEISNKVEIKLSNAPRQAITYINTVKDLSTNKPVKIYQYTGKNIQIDFLRTDEKTIIYKARLDYNFTYPKILKKTISSRLKIHADTADAIEIGCDMEHMQLFFEKDTISSIVYGAYVD